jgi:hypothetical protein
MFVVLETNLEYLAVPSVESVHPPMAIMVFSEGFCFFNATNFEYIWPLAFVVSVSIQGSKTSMLKVLASRTANAYTKWVHFAGSMFETV